MRVLLIVAAIGCGGSPAKPTPPPPREAPPVAVTAPVDAAAAVAIADAAVETTPALPAVIAIDPDSLPAWQVPNVAGSRPAVDVYAVDMDADRLLLVLATDDLIALPANKTLTGRLSAPSREAAYAAVAAELGVDIKPPKLAHAEPFVSIQYASMPAREVLGILGDTGRVNVITSAPLPELDIRVKRGGWSAVLAQVAAVTGHTVLASGNMRYVVPGGTKLPPLPKVASPGVVTIQVNGGTMGHAIAALRALTEVPIGACDSPPFEVAVRKAPLAEVVRALSVTSGATLAPGACKSTTLASSKVDDLRLVAIAIIGDRRAAAFDRNGEIVTATQGGLATEIGSTYVTVGQQTLELFPRQPPPVDTWRRTAALVHSKDGWSAFVATDAGYVFIDPRMPTESGGVADEHGVHAGDRDFPLGRSSLAR